MTERMFPIQDALDIPWAVIAPYEKWALKNHSQNLERLAQRCGLGATEAVAVLEMRPWVSMSLESARERLLEIVGDSPAILHAHIAELEDNLRKSKNEENRLRSLAHEIEIERDRIIVENKAMQQRILSFDPPEGLGY